MPVDQAPVGYLPGCMPSAKPAQPPPSGHQHCPAGKVIPFECACLSFAAFAYPLPARSWTESGGTMFPYIQRLTH